MPHDLTSVTSVQRPFLPQRPFLRVSGVELFFTWKPAKELSGDYLFTSVDGNVLTVEIGDVLGHGIDAALAMTALHGVFYTMRNSDQAPDEMIATANSFICQLVSTQHIYTSSMFVLKINVATGSI